MEDVVVFYETCVTDKFLDNKNYICLDLVDFDKLGKYIDKKIIGFISIGSRTKLEKIGFKFLIEDNPYQYTSQFLISYFNNLTLTKDMVLLPFSAILNGLQCDEFFIRPNTGDKYFPGCTVKYDDLDVFKNTYKVPGDVLCARSSIANILSEKRTFIDIENNKVITESLYSHDRNKSNTLDFDITDISSKIFAMDEKYMLPDIVVADFALLDNGEIKLIEFNCAITSGLYNCDINKLIDWYISNV